MRQQVLRVIPVLFLGTTLGGTATGAEPTAISIQHRPGVCFAVGQHARIEAAVEAAVEVETAQVFFHGADSTHWYAVDMQREGNAWVAALPRTAEGAERFAYYIAVQAGEARARAPRSSAYIVDLSPSCAGMRLPVADEGPKTLGVGPLAPRAPEGFDVADVEAFVETGPGQPSPTVSAGPAGPMVVIPFKRVRLSTVPPPNQGVERLEENGRSVTFRPDEGGEPLTRTKPGRFLHGEIESLEGDHLVLALAGGRKVVVRRQDLVTLEARQPGSPGRGIVGSLAGIAGGLLFTTLACVSIDDVCNSTTPFWLGAGAGAAIGAVAGGAPEWKGISLVPQRSGPVSLRLQPARAGAAVALDVRF